MTKENTPQRPLDYEKRVRDLITGQFDSKFNPEIAADIVETIANGYTLTAACGKNFITKQTIYNWQEEFPLFKEAVRAALQARQYYLENKFLDTKHAPDVTKYIFALKVAKTSDDWKETNAVELSGPDGGPIKSEVTEIKFTIVDPVEKKSVS